LTIGTLGKEGSRAALHQGAPQNLKARRKSSENDVAAYEWKTIAGPLMFHGHMHTAKLRAAPTREGQDDPWMIG
jgi:hypothetical protein